MRGGARIGAGRPRKVRIAAASAASPPGPFATAADFLAAVINAEDTSLDAKLRAATTLMPFQHAKPAPIPPLGKKAQLDADAQTAGRGTPWEEILRPRPPLALVQRTPPAAYEPAPAPAALLIALRNDREDEPA